MSIATTRNRALLAQSRKLLRELGPVGGRSTETRGRPEKHPWSTTPVGESFDVTCTPKQVATVRNSAYQASRRLGFVFSVSVTSNGCRATRTA